MAVHARFLENRYIGSLLDHTKDLLSKLHSLSKQEPRYKNSVTNALQAIASSLEHGALSKLNFRGSNLDGSTHRYVEELKNCYLGTSKEAPLPKQVFDYEELDGEEVYKDIPEEDVCIMKSLLLENAQEQVKTALEELSRKRASEEPSPRALRATKRVTLIKQQETRALALEHAERSRALQENVRFQEALESVQLEDHAFLALPEDLRANRDIIRAAVTRHFMNLVCVDPILYRDKAFMLELVALSPMSFSMVLMLLPEEFQSDIDFLVDIFTTLVNCNEPPILRDGLCVAMLKQLHALSITNETLLLRCARINPRACGTTLGNANISLRSNPDFLLRLIREVYITHPNQFYIFLGLIISKTTTSLLDQRSFLLTLISQYPEAMPVIIATTSLSSDTQFLLQVVRANNLDVILECASNEAKANQEFIANLIVRYPHRRQMILTRSHLNGN